MPFIFFNLSDYTLLQNNLLRIFQTSILTCYSKFAYLYLNVLSFVVESEFELEQEDVYVSLPAQKYTGSSISTVKLLLTDSVMYHVYRYSICYFLPIYRKSFIVISGDQINYLVF